MSAKKRILFIANEMSPYLEFTEFSEVVNKLAIKANDNGFEVRCIMPRFGIINERRHRLHEVVRLSGINVSIDNEDHPLQIKVARPLLGKPAGHVERNPKIQHIRCIVGYVPGTICTSRRRRPEKPAPPT